MGGLRTPDARVALPVFSGCSIVPTGKGKLETIRVPPSVRTSTGRPIAATTPPPQEPHSGNRCSKQRDARGLGGDHYADKGGFGKKDSPRRHEEIISGLGLELAGACGPRKRGHQPVGIAGAEEGARRAEELEGGVEWSLMG